MPEFGNDNLSLYSGAGERKYINRAERQRVLEVMEHMKRERALFSLLLAWTGGRISEVLSVTPQAFQIERNIVTLRTLKRRRTHFLRQHGKTGRRFFCFHSYGIVEQNNTIMTT
jgi:integrase